MKLMTLYKCLFFIHVDENVILGSDLVFYLFDDNYAMLTILGKKLIKIIRGRISKKFIFTKRPFRFNTYSLN